MQDELASQYRRLTRAIGREEFDAAWRALSSGLGTYIDSRIEQNARFGEGFDEDPLKTRMEFTRQRAAVLQGFFESWEEENSKKLPDDLAQQLQTLQQASNLIFDRTGGFDNPNRKSPYWDKEAFSKAWEALPVTLRVRFDSIIQNDEDYGPYGDNAFASRRTFVQRRFNQLEDAAMQWVARQQSGRQPF